MTFRQTPRYPEISPSMTMDEIANRWSELIRLLNDRDQQPLDPAQVFGRNIEVGGVNNQNIAFVTAGTSLNVGGAPAPTADYWHIYQYQIPRDVGLVYVEPVSVSATANIQVRTFLPLAEAVEGRTITICFGSSAGSPVYGTFNLGVFAASGSSDEIIQAGSGVVAIQNNTTGSISIDVSTSTRFTDTSGLPVPAGFSLMALDGSSLHSNFAVSVGGGSAQLKSNPISTTLQNETAVSGSFAVTVQSTGSYTRPLNYTFRAFGNRWIQVL
jgi:hypothetical protein